MSGFLGCRKLQKAQEKVQRPGANKNKFMPGKCSNPQATWFGEAYGSGVMQWMSNNCTWKFFMATVFKLYSIVIIVWIDIIHFKQIKMHISCLQLNL